MPKITQNEFVALSDQIFRRLTEPERLALTHRLRKLAQILMSELPPPPPALRWPRTQPSPFRRRCVGRPVRGRRQP